MNFKTAVIWIKIVLCILPGMISFASCKPRQSKHNLEDLYAGIIRNDLNDKAFKNTAELKIYNLFVLRIDTITRNSVDSELIKRALDRIEYCNAMADLHLSMSKSTARLDALYKKMKKTTLPASSLEDIREDDDKVKIYQDSVKYYLNLDSVITQRINNNKHPDTIYRVKTFLKATEKKSGDSTNYMDSFFYYIGKDQKVIDLTDLN